MFFVGWKRAAASSSEWRNKWCRGISWDHTVIGWDTASHWEHSTLNLNTNQSDATGWARSGITAAFQSCAEKGQLPHFSVQFRFSQRWPENDPLAAWRLSADKSFVFAQTRCWNKTDKREACNWYGWASSPVFITSAPNLWRSDRWMVNLHDGCDSSNMTEVTSLAINIIY